MVIWVWFRQLAFNKAAALGDLGPNGMIEFKSILLIFVLAEELLVEWLKWLAFILRQKVVVKIWANLSIIVIMGLISDLCLAARQKTGSVLVAYSLIQHDLWSGLEGNPILCWLREFCWVPDALVNLKFVLILIIGPHGALYSIWLLTLVLSRYIRLSIGWAPFLILAWILKEDSFVKVRNLVGTAAFPFCK